LNPRTKTLFALLTATVVLVAIALFLPRIPQPADYHNFADRRAWLGIANFLDVASNLPFGLFGCMGVAFLLQRDAVARFHDVRERWPYLVVFFGLLLTAFGSAYYHLAPDNARLVWDRLPMTITFMSLMAAVIAERVNVRLGLYLLAPLLALGISSVLVWYASELRGAGDLRFYAFIQAWGIVILPLAIWLGPARYTRSKDLLGAVGFYALAKVLESLDTKIFALGYIVGGHALKHLAAAMSGYWILRMLQKRQLVEICPE